MSRQVESRMRGPQRACTAAAVDHHGDVALGRTLGDGPHVDARGAERREHLGRHAVRARHAVTDHGQDAAAVIDLDAVDLAFAQFRVEGTAQDAFGALGLGLRHGEADRMLGAALRNEDDRDALLPQRAEQPVRRAGHADHARAFEVDERDAVDRRDALHQRIGVRALVDERAFLVRGKRVLDPDRDALLDRGRHGRGMNDLRTEVRQFHRLVVGKRVDHLRFRHQPRIGAQDAVDVRPDDDLGRIEQRTEDRRGVVAAIAAQGRLQALRIGRDEARDHQGADEIGRHQRVHVGARLLPAHPGAERTPLDEQRLARIEPLHVTGSPAAQQAFEQPRGPDLAVARDEVAHRGRGAADQAHRLQDAADVAAIGVQLRDELVAGFAGQQLPRSADVALPQLLQPIVEGGRVLLGQRNQAEQGIGHALACRQDDGLARGRIVLDDLRDALHARGVGDARSAELVDFPGLHATDSLIRAPAMPFALPRRAAGP